MLLLYIVVYLCICILMRLQLYMLRGIGNYLLQKLESRHTPIIYDKQGDHKKHAVMQQKQKFLRDKGERKSCFICVVRKSHKRIITELKGIVLAQVHIILYILCKIRAIGLYIQVETLHGKIRCSELLCLQVSIGSSSK